MSTLSEWYVVEGHPSLLYKVRFGSGKTWNNNNELRVKWRLELERQRGTKQMYCGPIKLIVVFYYPIPQRLPQHFKKSVEESSCVMGPVLSRLIRFMEQIGKGILFQDENSLCSLEVERKYGAITRTEFKVVPLHD